MRRFFILAALLLVTISSFAQDGRSIYQKYSDTQFISAVYVSPAMFKMIGKLPDLQMKNMAVDFSPIIKSLTGLYIISSNSLNLSNRLCSDVKNLVNSGKYELFMEAKESMERVRIYTAGDETTVSSFVMLASGDGSATFICLDGNMNRSDLNYLLAELIK